MNSVKNAIVTMTLLAVGYGAYVILNNPVPEDLGELAETASWEPPQVVAPTTGVPPDTALSAIDQTPGIAASSALPEQGPLTSGPFDHPVDVPSNSAAPYVPATDSDPQVPEYSTESGLALSPPSGQYDAPATYGETSPDQAAAGTVDSATDGGNFYVSQSTDPPATETYPSTTSADLPLPSPTDNAPRGNESYGDARQSGGGESGFEGTWRSAQEDLKSGQLATALAALSAWYEEASLTSDQRDRLVRRLDQLAGTVIYSRDSFLEPAYVIQQGDTLEMIAQQYQVPVDFLARINGIGAPYELFPGESIKVLRGPFRADIRRSQGQITIFLGNYYAGRFRARIGPELPPDAATYRVAAIEPGLEYFDTQTGNRVARDDPANPYGPLWISLRGNQITAGHNVGIHTDRGDPKLGCVAVREVDAGDLAAILGPGSNVSVSE